MRRDEARTDPPSSRATTPRRHGCERPPRDPSLSRVARALQAPFFRRASRPEDCAGDDGSDGGGGGRADERRRSRTHMSVVCNRRARGVPPYHRRWDSREDEHRSGRAVIARTTSRKVLAISRRRGSLLMLPAAPLRTIDGDGDSPSSERRSISRYAWNPLGCRRPTDSRVYGYTHGLTRSYTLGAGRGVHSRVL